MKNSKRNGGDIYIYNNGKDIFLTRYSSLEENRRLVQFRFAPPNLKRCYCLSTSRIPSDTFFSRLTYLSIFRSSTIRGMFLFSLLFKISYGSILFRLPCKIEISQWQYYDTEIHWSFERSYLLKKKKYNYNPLKTYHSRRIFP